MAGAGKWDTVIKNGTVVLKDEAIEADIGIKDGRIARIGSILDEAGAETIDASGLTVMPGMIDAHVHLNEPGMGHWEGFRTGSAALAAGGCTAYLDMPLNGIPPTVTVRALELKLAAAAGNSCVDYGLWGGLVPGKLDEIAPLHEAGVIGFKAFMSSPGDPSEDAFREVDDYTLLEGMKRIADTGKVLALHAESEPLVSRLAELMRREGCASAADYAASRPVVAELEAINRALFYAERTGCALHIVHISSAAGVRAVEDARKKGLDVTAETCPHYLKLTTDSMSEKGAAAKCAPPLRGEEEREALWREVAAGRVHIIASDHSPCPEEMKAVDDFFEAWGGIAGAQQSLEIMLGEGYVRRGLPLPLLARMTAWEPARRFGLLAAKGEIREGADADLALVDLNRSYTVERGHLYHRHPHSPYIGERMHCKVKATYSRGRLVYEEAAGLSDIRTGRWIKHNDVRR